MIEKNVNDLIRDIVKKMMPSTFKKAIISRVNINNSTADVYFAENPQNIIKNISFATGIDVSKIQNGSKCRVDIFDETNPNDMVIAYVYGGAGSSTTRFSMGNETVGTGGSTIAHNLGFIPSFVAITHEDNSAVTVYEYQIADIDNIYLKSSSGTANVNWCAIKF
jgi:hypothetical protein